VAGVFDYEIGAELAARVGPGHLVSVPFGKQTVQGVILRFVDTPAVEQTKLVLDALDPDPVLTPAQIALAESLAESTLSPLAAIVDLMLPPGLGQHADTVFAIREEGKPKAGAPLLPTAARLIKLLTERGPLRGRQIDRHFSNVDWRKSAHALVRRGVLTSGSVLPPVSVRPKSIRTAQLAVPLESAEGAMPALGKTGATLKRRQAALRFLMRTADAVNVSWVYAESGSNIADLQELADRELIVLRETEIWRDPLAEVRPWEPMTQVSELTEEQTRAWAEIERGLRASAEGTAVKPFLLHGVTGSGKTELYLRAVEQTARRGKSSIILVPEIALTPQTVRRFLERFPGQVGLIHSRLSAGERYDTWRRARAGLLKVVIGPRSALFAPLPNLGLIVADECHDSSYHQAEPPFYNAVAAAEKYARQAGALCILGSATPGVDQRYAAETGKLRLLELPRRIQISNGKRSFAELPPVSVVDMRVELKSGNRSIFSRELMDELQKTLGKNEQAILFLNRRGTATYVFCRDCGFVLKCPRCDSPLTYHLKTSERSNVPTLLCHHCGYERKKPKKCPQCGGAQIREYGLGSEKVESEVTALFPKARALRWDWETTRQKDSHEIILGHFAGHRADVLVGTQMLAKGLDLPLVTLVGIVLADVGLNLPDPFAAERVFQVLTQVAGRAGRSTRGGRVILQTFEPENRVIRAAAGHDYAGFYADELSRRKQLGYPPFGRLVRLEIRNQDAGRAEAAARQLAGKLQKQIESEGRRETSLIGPVPCFFSKLGGFYRWQVVLRGPDPASMLRGRTPDGWRIELDPISLL
jgi:primosomal protein N' (replication factor Y)